MSNLRHPNAVMDLFALGIETTGMASRTHFHMEYQG